MPEVADVFGRYGDASLETLGDTLLPSHRRAFQDILSCRTSARGGHVFACDRCGQRVYAYHSCRNRSCPKCHTRDTQAWLEARRGELLPLPYFHVVFTLPEQWRRIVRRRQKPLYGILMKAAAAALLKLAADPHYVGGLIGVMTILHTWSRTLEYHPHVHCLVPAGGVSEDRRWRPARKNYLVPVRALSRIFRGIFRDLVARELPDLQVPRPVRQKDWVVCCKPSVQGVDTVLNYLGRYVHRIAITNSRILSIEDGQVCFRYHSGAGGTWKVMTLEASEFIRRFLQHVLPTGVHKIRSYGLWAPSKRRLLRQIQLLLADDGASPPPNQAALPPGAGNQSTEDPQPARPAGQICPHCGKGVLLHLQRLPWNGRAPP